MAKADVGQMDNSTFWGDNPNEHPLNTPWAFWYDKKQNKKIAEDFRAGLQKLGSFNTVENFWKFYLYLKRPSALDLNVNLYLFRDAPNIAPMWECFPRGGCWILKIKKKRDSGASVLGKMWQDMVLSSIGEVFNEPDVVGISISIRAKEDLISVWNAENKTDDIRFKIGEKMKEILDLDPSTMIEYKFHAHSMADMSTFRNAKGYIFAPSEGNANAPANDAAAAVERVKL